MVTYIRAKGNSGDIVKKLDIELIRSETTHKDELDVHRLEKAIYSH